ICSERKKNGYTLRRAMRMPAARAPHKKKGRPGRQPERRYCGEKDVIAMGEISRRCRLEQAACHAPVRRKSRESRARQEICFRAREELRAPRVSAAALSRHPRAREERAASHR